jgi:hypothetical protein
MTTDQQALQDRQRTGCFYGRGINCLCPAAPHEYDGCHARSPKSGFARRRDVEDERDRLRDFVLSIADLPTGRGLSDANLHNLIERAKEVLGR